ncbi:MmcB family DNA repair protein [Cytobacillus sp. FJAT-54145]|uniref:MmcB family DNA repair protein n=1 Tax=Cytobacillus spartinae TaxID=3299023 RepID=A0ABW6K9X1_9BACI
MPRITGTDEVSLQAMEDLKNGLRVKELPERYDLSLDQAKRLSRYARLLEEGKGFLSPRALCGLQELGMHALVLHPLFERRDGFALEDILTNLPPEIKRRDVALLLEAVEEKRNRILVFQEKVHTRFENLKKNEEMVQKTEHLLKEQRKDMRKQVKALKGYEPEVQDFLLQHLGTTPNGTLCLAKRLDYRWQKRLIEKRVLEWIGPPKDGFESYFPTGKKIFSGKWEWEHQASPEEKENSYVFRVNDLNSLAEDLPRRWKRGWDTAWNYEKEQKREDNPYVEVYVPEDPTYDNPRITPLASDIKEKERELQEEKRRIQVEMTSLESELNALKNTPALTYLEQVTVRNTFSQKDQASHAFLQQQAMRYLLHEGYVVMEEVTLPNGRRVDVAGINEEGEIVFIEVKHTKVDFDRDQKWEGYLPYCDTFYFFLRDGEGVRWSNERRTHIEKKGEAGLLLFTGNRVEKQADCLLQGGEKKEPSFLFSLAKGLSKKWVFGF